MTVRTASMNKTPARILRFGALMTMCLVLFCVLNGTFTIRIMIEMGKGQAAQSDFLVTPEPRANELVSRSVDRIYYINLESNKKRRALMEGWLSKQSIPFQRINATVGSSDPTVCVSGKQQPNRCRGLSGLSMTQADIIQNHDTSGLTLVFEDDFVVYRPLNQLVNVTLAMVPPDWDIIRFDCVPNGYEEKSFRFVHTPELVVFRTICNYTADPNCYFCGGTYAMLWRHSSVHKLKKVWSRRPFEDVDCALTTPELKSYCVNIGVGSFFHPKGEKSNIPHN